MTERDPLSEKRPADRSEHGEPPGRASLSPDPDDGQCREPVRPPPEPDAEERDLLELLTFPARNRGSVALAAVLTGIIGFGVLRTMPDMYRAEAWLVIPPSALGGWSSVLGSGAAPFGLLAAQAPGYQSDTYEKVLTSRTIADKLIDRFDLMALFGSETRDQARKALQGRLSVETDSGLLEVSYLDTVPERAADVCNAAVQFLQDKFTEVQRAKNRERGRLLAERHSTLERELEEAEESLKALKLRHLAIQPEEQARMALKVLESILARYYAESAEVGVLEASQGPGAPELFLARSRLDMTQAQIRSLDGLPPVTGAGSAGVTALPSQGLIPLRRLPEMELQVSRGAARVRVLRELFALTTTELETTRMSELNELQALSVLDEAVPPQDPHSPRRGLYTFVFVLLGALFGLLRAGAVEWARELRRVEPERARQLGADLGWLGRRLLGI